MPEWEQLTCWSTLSEDVLLQGPDEHFGLMYHRLKVLHCVPISRLWNDLPGPAVLDRSSSYPPASISLGKLNKMSSCNSLVSAYKSTLSRFSPSPANCKEARYLLPGAVSSSVLAKHTKVCVHVGNLFFFEPPPF